jgi:virginiamycin B lyase
MGRQAVFGAVLGLALALGLASAVDAIQTTASNASSPAPRPTPEIPLERLVPDAVLSVTLDPGAAASADALWIADRTAGTIVRVEAKDNTVGPPITVGRQPCASLVVAFESVWVPLCDEHAVARVDIKERKVSATLKTNVASADGRIATGVGSLWILSDRKGVLSRIDPEINAPVAEIYVAGGATAVAASEDALWITSENGNRLTRVSPHSHETIETIEVGPKPGRLAVGEGGVWTLNRGDGSVTRVDPATNKVVATIPTCDASASGEIAAGAGSVWISAPGVPIIRIDPRTNRAVQKFTGNGGGAIVIAHGSLWVAAGPKTTWRLDPLLVATVRP